MSNSLRPMGCSMPIFPSFIISQNLLNLMFIELVMPSKHLILCHHLLLLPSIFPIIRMFSNESALCIRWPKYFSFSISPPSEYSGLTSFWIDWFDLLAVQDTAHLNWRVRIWYVPKVSFQHKDSLLVWFCYMLEKPSETFKGQMSWGYGQQWNLPQY